MWIQLAYQAMAIKRAFPHFRGSIVNCLPNGIYAYPTLIVMEEEIRICIHSTTKIFVFRYTSYCMIGVGRTNYFMKTVF